jgi:hypothetical protein
VTKGYVDILLSDYDPIRDALHDAALLFPVESGPTAVEILRLCEDLVGRKMIDFQQVDFRLEPRHFFIKLGLPFLERLVELAEPRWVQLAIQIQPVNLLNLLANARLFPFSRAEKLLLL